MTRLTRLSLLLVSLLAAQIGFAEQHAYVATFEDQRIEVIDVANGASIDTWRTNGTPRDMVASHLYNRLFLATENDATIHRIGVPGRVDLLLPNAGLYSHAVALNRWHNRLYLLQSGNQQGAGLLLDIDLFHPEVGTCLSNNTKNCNVTNAVATAHTISALSDPRYMVWSGASETLFMVDALGTVVEFDPATGTSQTLQLGSNPTPEDPRGMDASPDGQVVISANGPSGPALTVIDPDNGNAVTTTLLPISEAGGVAYDPAGRRYGYRILVGDIRGHDLLPVDGGQPGTPIPLGSGRAPVDVAVNHRGRIVTANENDSASVHDGTTTLHTSLTPQPVSVVYGRVEDTPELAPDPYEVGWTYARYGSSAGTRTVTLTSIGAWTARVSQLDIVGPDAASFQILSENCTTRPLHPDFTCQIEIEFVPAVSTGLRFRYHTHLATLKITSDAPPLALPLVGEHIATTIRLKPQLEPKFGFSWGD